MSAITGLPSGLGFLRSSLDRVLGSSLSLASEAPNVTTLTGTATNLVQELRSWLKPLLSIGPLAWLLSFAQARETTALTKIDEQFSENKSTNELDAHHRNLEKQGAYQFVQAQGTGSKPLVIVGLGTMQDFSSKEAGLMDVVDHLRKNQPNVHVLVLKSPDAAKALKHLLCIDEDASANTAVRTKENTQLISDVIKARGRFAGIEVSGVCPVGFSWGAGMLCAMRKEGVFDNLRVPILGTATVDAIKPGIENLGEGLTDLAAAQEPNLHIYQDETYYGLNGTCAKDLGPEDEVHKRSAVTHEEIDNDPWVTTKICRFLDKVISLNHDEQRGTPKP